MTIRTKWQTARARFWLRNCVSLGDKPYLAGKPTIEIGRGRVSIGHRFRLASRPVTSHLVAGPDAVLQIGNDVSIGSGAAIAAFSRVSIGDGSRIGPYVIIMDTNFHGAPGDQSVQHQCLPVTIGDGCRIGSRVTITRGATIGDGAEILAGSVVSSEIPPGVCAAGVRARIIGRAGDMSSRWDSAAAVLPEILMRSLELKSPPDLNGDPIPRHLWTDARRQNLLGAIEASLGLVLASEVARDITTFAEIAAAVQHALQERPARAGGL